MKLTAFCAEDHFDCRVPELFGWLCPFHFFKRINNSANWLAFPMVKTKSQASHLHNCVHADRPMHCQTGYRTMNTSWDGKGSQDFFFLWQTAYMLGGTDWYRFVVPMFKHLYMWILSLLLIMWFFLWMEHNVDVKTHIYVWVLTPMNTHLQKTESV